MAEDRGLACSLSDVGDAGVIAPGEDTASRGVDLQQVSRPANTT